MGRGALRGQRCRPRGERYTWSGGRRSRRTILRQPAGAAVPHLELMRCRWTSCREVGSSRHLEKECAMNRIRRGLGSRWRCWCRPPSPFFPVHRRGRARGSTPCCWNKGWAVQAAGQSARPPRPSPVPGSTRRRWHRTTVPSTVLAALVTNGVYPDPFTGATWSASMQDSSDSPGGTGRSSTSTPPAPRAASGSSSRVSTTRPTSG